MDEILKRYDDRSSLYEEFRTKTENLLRDLVNVKGMTCHQITSRLKTRSSLSNKLSNKLGYSTLEDITDVVGCRIITYFEDDVDKIASIIENEFQVDGENTIDKRKVDYDRFGYLSLHYVVMLSNKRLRLAEYKKFKECKLEIQIRSLLQHGWAEIEHDIGYKGKYSIPDVLRRRFSRIAALLETADIEFVRLREDLKFYENNIEKRIQEDSATVTINKASLASFISNNEFLQKADAAISEHLDIDLKENSSIIENVISIYHFCGINSISELESLYKANFDCIIKFSKFWRIQRPRPSTETRGVGASGISLFDLGNYFIAKSKSKEEFQAFVSKQYKSNDVTTKSNVDRIFSAFSHLDKGCKS